MSVPVTGEQVVGIGFFAFVVLGVIFAFIDNRRARDERNKPLPPLPRETAFRKPRGVRLFMALLAAFIITGYPLLYAVGAFDVRGHRPHFTAETWTLFGIVEIIGIATGLPLLYLSGPNEFFLDVERRTYRHVYGWPFRPQVREGSWEEMAGVYVRFIRMTYNEQYIVGIAWKCPRSHSPVLGAFSRPRQADRWAEGVAATLDLPLVEPPPSRKQSTMGRC